MGGKEADRPTLSSRDPEEAPDGLEGGQIYRADLLLKCVLILQRIIQISTFGQVQQNQMITETIILTLPEQDRIQQVWDM